MLSEKKEEEWLQSVATEFNLSQTCYLTPIVDVDSELKNENPTFQLRWFTPVAEVKKNYHVFWFNDELPVYNGLGDTISP